MKQEGVPNLTAIFLHVDKGNLIKRISNRKTCENCQAMYKNDMPEYNSGVCSKCSGKLVVRADDDPTVIEKRFEEYITKTAPVKDYYDQKGLLKEVNGDQPIEKVHQDIVKVIQV